jgi:integrating conjugative element protein (TIGR03759 family)
MILFPYASRLNLPGAEARAVTGSGHVALFVKEGCAPCDALAREFQAVGTPFDVYMVGSRQDDVRVLSWATHVGIDPGKVHVRAITLDHDGGRWLSLDLPGELPAAVRDADGAWQRQ